MDILFLGNDTVSTLPAVVGPEFSAYNLIWFWVCKFVNALSFPMIYLIYSFLFTLAVLLTAPYYLWKRRDELAGRLWKERFGLLPESFQQSERGPIWIHAVSVGETLAVARLVRDLQGLYPNRKIFMSSVTPAGRAAGESRCLPWPDASTCPWIGGGRWTRP